MKIKNRVVSSEMPPLVIAEIGINHQGDLDLAKAMVGKAAASGCECIKHQTHILEDEMTDVAKTIIPPNASISIWEIMEQCCLSPEAEAELKEYTESLGLIYISTPFSRKAADFLYDINVPAFKIGSGECDNLPLVKHIASKGLPIIMSTGMQTIDSLKASVDLIEKADVDFALLECTNLYPAPPSIVSLSGINELRTAFPKAEIGFSDHSMGPTMALAAVALGATIIERHFTDTRYRKGPDIACSMDPAELRYLIDRSSEVHQALHVKKMRSEPEEDVYKFARGSVVADKNLKAGHIIEESDVWTRRPGTGEIPAGDYFEVIGKKLKVDVVRNEFLSWDQLD